MGFFEKIKSSLAQTKNTMVKNIEKIFSRNVADEELFGHLEETLILGDVGVNTSAKICDELRTYAKKFKISELQELKSQLVKIISNMLSENDNNDNEKISNDHIDNVCNYPNTIILVIGVNGVGKTTTVGKLAHCLKKDEKSVLIAAADTFRAAAIEQLEVLSEKAEVKLVKNETTTDPSAVIFDAIKIAKSENMNTLICDTAGRLHNKKNLMAELGKIEKVIKKSCPYANLETLLVLDSTIGQNAIIQAKEFKNIVNITGIILTKLDGTSKGGVCICVKEELGVPIKYVGFGESLMDLEIFNSEKFAKALFD